MAFNSKSFQFIKIATVAVALVLSAASAQARNCNKGKPCGNSCISKNDVCHKDTPAAEAPAAAAAAPAPGAVSAPATAPVAAPAEAPAAAAKAKNCKKGKACGNTCIPADAVCHT